MNATYAKRFLCILLLGLVPVISIADDLVRAEETLALIETWFGGVYDNSAQIAADEANNLPAEKRQMPLHQIVARVTIDSFDGLTYFQQLTNDGTPNTLLGVGIYHFDIHEPSGTVRLRLHMFEEAEPWIDAHLDPDKLKNVTPDELRTTPGCEFYLVTDSDMSHIRGSMGDDPGCYPVSRSTGKKMHHVDELVIRPGELWNNARYFDLEGNQLFGNTTGEYAKQIRIAP